MSRAGTVEARKGRWRAKVHYDGKQHTVGTFATEQEAREAIAAVLARRAQSSPAVPGETLLVWSRKWLDARATDGVHRSVQRDRHAVKRWQRAPIAALALVEVTPHDVRRWCDAQLKTGAAQQTVQNALNLLRVCLEEACRAGRIAVNPARGVQLPRRAARQDDPWTWLTAAELAALLAAIDDDTTRDAVTVAAYTGLRAGELFGLRWRDVDVRRGEVAVRGSWKGTPTKTGRTRRVQLLTPAVEALERQRARSGARAHVFPDRDGEPRGRWQIPSIAAALEAARIGRHVRWHDLRHTCASLLLQGAWAPVHIARALTLAEVGAWLGHRSPASTARYAHLCPEGLHGLVVRQKPKLVR